MSDLLPATLGRSFRRAGKALEHTALQFRSYVHPAHLWTYWKLTRRAHDSNGDGRPLAYFDFTRVEIDHVNGRYLFALVRDFEALGFLPCYRKRFRFLATMQHKSHKRLLLARPFRLCNSLDELPAKSVAVEITDRRAFPENPAHRQIRVRYDAAWPRSDREVAMTFFVHPLLYDQWLALPEPDLNAPRSWRIFFSGKMASRKYNADTLPVQFGKMSRPQMLHALAEELPADRLRRVETAADLEADPARPPQFVWADTARFKIPRADWLNILNRADFFLACPGTDMPLCHNLIEALSRGAVPILEHPEFLEPPLRHDIECLVFHGRDELLKTFDRIFRMSPDGINRLRRGAFAYHQKNLRPGMFARRLLDAPHPRVDLLLNAYRVPRPAPD